MKVSTIIIVLVLVMLCVGGWFAFLSDSASASDAYDRHIAQAEEYLQRGLYQRSADSVLAALGGENDEELYERAVDAYSLYYAKAPEESAEGYLELLERAVGAFPANTEFLNRLIPFYSASESYRKLYDCLHSAVQNGCEDPEILEQYTSVRYLSQVRGNSFDDMIDPGTGIYTVKQNGGWNLYTWGEGYRLLKEYEFVGPCSADGVAVVKNGDMTIYDIDESKVLGILPSEVEAAGLFSEGLIAARIDGSWNYYDELGTFLFGGFETAGTFKSGLAAVEQNGKWHLTDTDGLVSSDEFDDIALSLDGLYMVNGTVLASDGGRYVMYDADWKELWSLECDETGARTEDGVTAFRRGSLWGFVNDVGEVVIEPQYTGARSFSCGVAAVENAEGLWGFIDLTGRTVIDFSFTSASHMSPSGVCPVQTGEAELDRGWEEDAPTGRWTFLVLELGVTED